MNVELNLRVADVPIHYSSKYSWVLDKLAELPADKSVAFPLPAGVKPSAVQGMPNQAAVRREMFIGTRTINGEMYVFRSQRERKVDGWQNSKRSRNSEIVVAVGSGETYQAVADKFNLTRQRVQQIVVNAAPRQKLLRKAAAAEFIAPYLKFLSESDFCISCSEPLPSHNRGICCHKCNKAAYYIRVIKSRLRKWNCGAGHRQYLSQAIHEIRKANLKPEDLAIGAKRASHA